MKYDEYEIRNAVAILVNNGFVPVNKGQFNNLKLEQGSIANCLSITLGDFVTIKDPIGNEHTACFVKYERLKESGEDCEDFTMKETRYVKLEKLTEYLISKGCYMPELTQNIDIQEEADYEK